MVQLIMTTDCCYMAFSLNRLCRDSSEKIEMNDFLSNNPLANCECNSIMMAMPWLVVGCWLSIVAAQVQSQVR